MASQISDGTANRSYSAASLPKTRIVDQTGRTFYVLEVPYETGVIQTSSGAITPQPGTNGFVLRSPAPTYTITAVINGVPATIKSVDGIGMPSGTSSVAINDYSPATQGRMMRVDLWINEGEHMVWAAGFFSDPNAPEAAPTADPDGQSNEVECAAGTEPRDGTSAFLMEQADRLLGGNVTVCWRSLSGRTYQVRHSPDLAAETWQPVGQSAGADGTSVSASFTAPAGHYYRIRGLPSP